MNYKKIKFVLFLLVLYFIFFPQLTLAQSYRVDVKENLANLLIAHLGIDITLPLPLIIANIVRFALSLVGMIFLVLIIVAGIRWMTAAGNEEQITKAMSTIKNAGIGLLIIFAAYSITYTIFLLLERASKTP